MTKTKTKIEDEQLATLRKAFDHKMLLKAQAASAEADWSRAMTVIMIDNGRRADLDRVCLDCGTISRTGACECEPEK